MARFLWICLGGAAGTGARYLLSGWLLRAAGPGFPWGTLAVNVIGSFLLGVLLQLSLATDLRLALTVGGMGGFTTYSSFNSETLQYLLRDEWLTAFAYGAATLLVCLAAGALGLLCGRLLAAS
ncbi:MAG: CrcB family protein [Thermoanaerobaculia bacterium]